MINSKDILHEAGKYWVLDTKYSYAVMITGITHSTSESAYPYTEDGLQLAIIRCDYLHNRKR